MKNNLFFLIILTCIIFTSTNCSHLTKNDLQKDRAVVAGIGNDCFAMNLSSSYVLWLAGSCGGGMSGIPVYKDDLLFVSQIGEDDLPLFIQHKNENETPAYYTYAKIQNHDYLYTCDNSIIQINFENKPEIWGWLENAAKKEIETIKTLTFSRDIEPSYFPLLKKIAKINHHPGIFVRNPWELMHILPMFQPEWLFIEEWKFSPDKKASEEELLELLKKQRKLKTFCYMSETKEFVPHYKILSALPSLKNLILTSSAFNEAAQPELPESLINLEEILIYNKSGEKINNISTIKKLTNLKKIRIIGATIEESPDELSTIPNLTTLSFAGTKVKNIQSIIKMIPSLLWFSFPENISQKDFELFITSNPRLEYCEFFGCEDIKDLSPLMNLSNLKGLMLIDMKINDYSPLYNLKDPDFIVLPEKFFKEDYDTRREEFQKELQDSKLICGTPFCLGSGWIIVIPFIIVLCLVIIVYSKKRKKYTKENSIIEK
ncbi:MAG: hypothetical protein JXJ04_19420 [Spirochaetales bacterium]|nr:hypothetical protein [Spirochaetales bacterium]